MMKCPEHTVKRLIKRQLLKKRSNVFWMQKIEMFKRYCYTYDDKSRNSQGPDENTVEVRTPLQRERSEETNRENCAYDTIKSFEDDPGDTHTKVENNYSYLNEQTRDDMLNCLQEDDKCVKITELLHQHRTKLQKCTRLADKELSSTVDCSYMKHDSDANVKDESRDNSIMTFHPSEVPGPSEDVLKILDGEVGPGASKTSIYKNPEYFCYHKLSFANAELELTPYRQKQPSNKPGEVLD